MVKNFVILLLLTLSSFLMIGKPVNSQDKNVEEAGKKNISLLLTGFGSINSDGDGVGEIAPFLNKLQEKKDVSGKIGMCDLGFEGYIYGNRVLVVSSGMAKVKTSACLMDILQNYGDEIKEVVFVGIAGITPAKNGMKEDFGNSSVSEEVMLGDVCINSVAFDFDLQHYTSDNTGSNIQSPLYWDQTGSFASQFIIMDSNLAKELHSASSKVNWLAQPQEVKNINLLYHGINRLPRVWGMDECLEATGDTYWHDIYSDNRAREMASEYLNQAYGSAHQMSDVLIVTAMEAVPSGVIVKWWNENNNGEIAFAYVRSASNFSHANLNSRGNPLMSGRESIERFGLAGTHQYAIETAALPVLKMFELRSVEN